MIDSSVMLNHLITAYKYQSIILLSLLIGVGFKIWLIISNYLPFNADEAVVALMARHILGGERPIYFYGQSYMGSLDAYLVAGGFALFGQKVSVIRAVQVLLYIFTILTTSYLATRISRTPLSGALAASLMAIPNVNMSLYTSVSLGGYGEMLLIGNLILITAIKLGEQIQQSFGQSIVWLWFSLGFLIGLGFWVFSLTLVYSVPAYLYLIWEIRKYIQLPDRKQGLSSLKKALTKWLFASGIGLLLGAVPCLIFILQAGLQGMLKELSGSAIAGVEKLPWISLIPRRIINTVVLGMSAAVGLRPPWEVRWLALPLAPLALATWTGSAIHAYSSLKRAPLSNIDNNKNNLVFFGVVITLLAGFTFTPFGADPSGRYFLPVSIILVLFAAHWLVELGEILGKKIWLICFGISLFHFWGTLEAIKSPPGGLTTQFDAVTWIDHSKDEELIQFLSENNLTRGYSNYWVTYPLAFLSGERLIYLPRLPYHLDFRYTSRDDRYKPYQVLVAQADRIAYITTKHPDLDDYLREKFSLKGITWKEVRIGDYQIFFQLTQVVSPEELGLIDEN